MEKQDTNIESIIKDRLKHMGYSYDVLDCKVKDYLVLIEVAVSEVFRREEEARELTRYNSINIKNIVEKSEISRQTIYNHKVLKEYIDYCSRVFESTDISAELEKEKEKNKSLRSEIETYQRRDIEFMELKLELKDAKKQIEYLTEIINSEKANIYSFNKNRNEKSTNTFKFVSWNVNGINSCLQKGLADYLDLWDADIICLQETRNKKDGTNISIQGYYQYWNYSSQPGYAGVAVFAKSKPLSVHYGMEEISKEDGRVIILEYSTYYLVNVYAPNPLGDVEKLINRIDWNNSFVSLLNKLTENKEVIVCGDLNVDANVMPDDMSDEYNILDGLTRLGFSDAYNYKYPKSKNVYSWEANYGGKNKKRLRLDYFYVMRKYLLKISDINYLTDVNISDHIPVELVLEM